MSDLEMPPSEQDMAYDLQQENARKERIEQFGFDVLDQSLWKTFNSKKQVKSVPMTRGIYNKYQGWETPENENPEDVGYLIEYLDGGKPNHPDHEGYISWSPKDVFDRNHSPVSERGLTPSLQILDESPFIPLSIKRHRIHIELDPSDPAGEEYVARLKSLIKEAGGTGPRGLIAGLPMMDEASFYPNGVPMTIYKSKPLGNGMALGTVETLSGENGKLDFSDALRALKFGYRVQRSGWNGKDMWLSVSNLNTATVPADKFWSPHNSEYAKNNGGSAEVPPCITMKNAKGQIQMGWVPSPEDMFCSDWFAFEKQDEFSGTDDIATMTSETETFASKSEPVDINKKLGRPQFDCIDPNFVKVRDRLESFLENGARAVHGPHREAMYDVQLTVMELLTKIVETYGSDIGEHGEVLTNLSFGEALLFTASGFEIRHKDWKLGEKLTPTLSDLEYVFMRTGEETPWVATDEELRSDGWILLYKED